MCGTGSWTATRHCAYFGADVDGLVSQLLDDQPADGGWNCWTEHGSVRSSFHSTICVLEGLLEHERATGGSDRGITARHRAEDDLLQRRLMRRLTSGEVVDPNFLRFSFLTWWHYDVLRALDHFRAAGAPPEHAARPAGAGLVPATSDGDEHDRAGGE